MSDLTPEESAVLKEFAQNLLSAGRVGRIVRGALIFFATAIGAGYVVWEFLPKIWGK